MKAHELICINSFTLDGGSMPILVGEVFYVFPEEDMYTIVGSQNSFNNREAEYTLTENQFANFKYVKSFTAAWR